MRACGFEIAVGDGGCFAALLPTHLPSFSCSCYPFVPETALHLQMHHALIYGRVHLRLKPNHSMLARCFLNYYRLMIVHFGIPYWQVNKIQLPSIDFSKLFCRVQADTRG